MSEVFESSVQKSLVFLTEEFNKGASYQTLYSARSALSLIMDQSLGSDPQINRLFKGVFRLNPCRPKYSNTWDPSIVLNLLKTWFPLENLKFKTLSKKVVMLLALASGQRIQTLAAISLKNIIFSESGVVIQITEHMKTSAPGRPPIIISLPSFPLQEEICPVFTLKFFIQKSEQYRAEDVGDTEKLLISCQRPHKPPSNQTISRWIRQVMKESGLDISKFTPHSTRHASTSAASREGVPLDEILKAAGWSMGSTTFAKHYRRPLDNKAHSFAKAVCQKGTYKCGPSDPP